MKRIMERAIFLTVVALAGTVAHADVDPCAAPETQLQMDQCAGLALQNADKALNTAYKAVEHMEMATKDSPGLKLLKTAENAWINFRDTECNYEGAQYQGGSIQPMIIAGCKTDLSNKRTAELNVILKNQQDH
jgi:uncharacterized protein YecT (DUF1311 family)